MSLSTRRGSGAPASLSLAQVDAIRAAAAEDVPSATEFVQQLVRVPSRGGLDPYEPVIELVDGWLGGHGLAPRRLTTAHGELVGLACDVPGAYPGPRYVLDACVDTAPFGDETAWRHPPTAGVVEDGWLYGRGAADSKAAVAIFAHVAARLRAQAGALHGTLTLLYDADEHTGRFGGARHYFAGPDAPADVAGVMIGYPGLSKVVVGGRGFLRAALVVHGQAAHTGSNAASEEGNAVEKAALLISALQRYQTPAAPDPELGLPAKLTVTAVHGGQGYSIVPDRCEVHVDVRLTPSFEAGRARALLDRVVTELDARWPTARSTEVRYEDSWPAYRLEEASPVRVALLEAAAHHLEAPPRAKVAGPSNIGCYLASLGIDATAGFGVAYQGLHGTNECIEIATIPTAQAVYHHALLSLLSSDFDRGRRGTRR
jgi:succinyl-diaminopimelate desuccinylase